MILQFFIKPLRLTNDKKWYCKSAKKENLVLNYKKRMLYF